MLWFAQMLSGNAFPYAYPLHRIVYVKGGLKSGCISGECVCRLGHRNMCLSMSLGMLLKTTLPWIGGRRATLALEHVFYKTLGMS